MTHATIMARHTPFWYSVGPKNMWTEVGRLPPVGVLLPVSTL